MFSSSKASKTRRKEKGWPTEVGQNSWWHMKCAQQTLLYKLSVGCYDVWTDLCISGISPLGFFWKSIVKWDLSGLDIKHLVNMPIGHVVIKIHMPCKNVDVPSQYLYKPCKAYVYCWKNKYMPRLKIHLPRRAHNHKSLCPGIRSTCPVHAGTP